MSEVLLSARGISKVYQQGEGELEILKSVDLDIYQGESLCILGASGAGKSTLLHILGTLDRPTAGQLFYRDENLLYKSDQELAQFRNQKMGFVFQFHHLLAEFTALENIMMPARIAGVAASDSRRRAEHLCEILGLQGRETHFPSQLSGGERQRVAVARALMRDPEVLFADEPTGNLDKDNCQKVQELFFELQQRLGLSLVVVTHDPQFASRFPRRLLMEDGRWVQSRPSVEFF